MVAQQHRVARHRVEQLAELPQHLQLRLRGDRGHERARRQLGVLVPQPEDQPMEQSVARLHGPDPARGVLIREPVEHPAQQPPDQSVLALDQELLAEPRQGLPEGLHRLLGQLLDRHGIRIRFGRRLADRRRLAEQALHHAHGIVPLVERQAREPLTPDEVDPEPGVAAGRQVSKRAQERRHLGRLDVGVDRDALQPCISEQVDDGARDGLVAGSVHADAVRKQGVLHAGQRQRLPAAHRVLQRCMELLHRLGDHFGLRRVQLDLLGGGLESAEDPRNYRQLLGFQLLLLVDEPRSADPDGLGVPHLVRVDGHGPLPEPGSDGRGLRVDEGHEQRAQFGLRDAPLEHQALQLEAIEQLEERAGERAPFRELEPLAVREQHLSVLRQVQPGVLREQLLERIAQLLERLRDRLALRRIQLVAAHGRHESAEHVGHEGDALRGEAPLALRLFLHFLDLVARRLRGVEHHLGVTALHLLVAPGLLLVRGALEMVGEQRG